MSSSTVCAFRTSVILKCRLQSRRISSTMPCAMLEDIARFFIREVRPVTQKLVKHTHRNELAAAFRLPARRVTSSRKYGHNGYPMFHVAGDICLHLAP